MLNTYLYIFWIFFYLICATLGVLGLPGWVGISACCLFFLPPSVLLYRLGRAGDRKGVARIRNIALIWLAFTALMIILNIASVSMSAAAGDALYYAMAVLCAPMVCGKYWLLSMFLFACLLAAGNKQLKGMK